jgi:hypothetical protein
MLATWKTVVSVFLLFVLCDIAPDGTSCAKWLMGYMAAQGWNTPTTNAQAFM